MRAYVLVIRSTQHVGAKGTFCSYEREQCWIFGGGGGGGGGILLPPIRGSNVAY